MSSQRILSYKLLRRFTYHIFFAIECGETADVAESSHVSLVGSSIEEEMLCSRPLETTNKAEDVFQLVARFFDNSGTK